MRYTTVVLSLLVSAGSFTSTLVHAAPIARYSPNKISPRSLDDTTQLLARASQLADTPTLETLGLAKPNTQYYNPSIGAADGTSSGHAKRASDFDTAGGNAYTGDTGNVSSGHVLNEAGQDNTITNTGGNSVPMAGNSISGNATGGEGDGIGPGGNAYTGNTGNADGGYIENEAGMVNNMGMGGNNGGQGGTSMSGAANGGGS